MRRADVCAWRHHRDVGCDRDQEPGRGRAASARADEDHHRGLGRDDPGVDLTGGVDQAAGGTKRQHDQGRVLSIRAIDRLNDVCGRDRVDEGIYFRRVHDRCRGETWSGFLRGQTSTEPGRRKPRGNETNVEPWGPHFHRSIGWRLRVRNRGSRTPFGHHERELVTRNPLLELP